MSVIGAEIRNTTIRFACDSQTTEANRAILDGDDKVFLVKHFIVGISGDAVYKQHFKRFLENTLIDTNRLNECLDVSLLFNAFLEEYKECEYLRKTEEGASVIISDSRKVFSFGYPDFSCHEIKEYTFSGSGWEVAEGAYIMHKKLEQSSNIKSDALKEALLIACEKDIYCAQPVKLIEIAKAE